MRSREQSQARRAGSAVDEARSRDTQQADLVHRNRLHRLLDYSPVTARTLLCAPAGYGKSTLLRSWLARHAGRRPTVVIRLTAQHNDRASFWRTVGTTVRAGGVPLQDTALPPLAPDDPAAVPHQFAAALDALDSPLLLAIDDLHLATAEVVDDLETVLAESANLRVVAATRRPCRLASSKAALAGELIEIGATDLAFDAAETRLALHSLGVEVHVDATAVFEHTSGWPAAVRLYATELLRHDPTDHQEGRQHCELASFTRFATEEILAPRDPADTHFLLRAAVPDELTADLAETVCGEPGTRHRFAAAVAEGLLRPAAGTWHGYPPVLRTALRHEQERRLAAETAQLHQRAATWYAAAGRPWQALRHTRQGADEERASALLRTHWPALVDTDPAAFIEATAALAADDGARDPALLVASAWAHELCGADAHTIRRLTDAATSQLECATTSTDLLLAQSASLISASMSSDPTAAIMSASSIAAQLDSNVQSETADLFWLRLGLAQLLAGDLGSAARSLRRARHAGQRFVAQMARSALALVNALLGRATRRRRRPATRTATQGASPSSPTR